MKFNEEQTKIIYEFVMNYTVNEEFKNDIEEKYNNEVERLSILEIYALEEVLRFGTRNLFNQFLETKENLSEEEAIVLFDNFFTLLREDESFRDYKLMQFREAKETLSAMEIFAINLIYKEEKQENESVEESTIELEYAELNPIRFGTDRQIRATIENLLFGQFILNALELPTMSEIKSRQKERGVIANSDKPIIIEEIRKLLAADPKLYENAVNNHFVKIKFQVLLGNKEASFGELLDYNTNISADEIFGREKDTTEEDTLKFFQDMVNKIKNEKNNGPRK